jgi:transcriptional regulator with XRE-family HTH domain
MELRLWRVERKLTMINLAKALGVSRNTLWNWENGAARMPMDIVSRLERVMISIAIASKPVAEVDEGPTEKRKGGKLYRRDAETGDWTNDARRWTLEGCKAAREEFQDSLPPEWNGKFRWTND